MAGITLAIAQAHLDTWLAAETAIGLGQSVAHDGRVLTRADLNAVRAQIEYWNNHLQKLTRGPGLKVQRVILHG